MPVTLCALTTLADDGQDALQTYLNVAGGLLEKAGARVRDRYQVGRTVVGTDAPQFVTLIDYPSEDEVRQVFESPAYRQLETARNTAFSSYTVFQVGDPAI